MLPGRSRYECSLCGYRGPFRSKTSRRYALKRRHSKCLCCGANERTRFLCLVLRELVPGQSLGDREILHVAPEAQLERVLRPRVRRYVSGDLERKDVDRRLDIQSLPFGDQSFDLVIASHVLMYVPNDRAAIAEIRRVLRPGGMALLPVPVMGEKTADENDGRFRHQPGMDYPERYRPLFDRVTCYFSTDFDPRFQVSIHEEALPGAQHPVTYPESMRLGAHQYQDMVPVCFVF